MLHYVLSEFCKKSKYGGTSRANSSLAKRDIASRCIHRRQAMIWEFLTNHNLCDIFMNYVQYKSAQQYHKIWVFTTL